MKKFLVVAALVLSLSACGGKEDTDAFNDSLSVSMSNEDALDIGRQFCTYLDDGKSMDDILEHAARAVLESGGTGSDAVDVGEIFASASQYLCPKYEDKVQSYLDSDAT